MTTFEALSARRRAYVEAARDNGFEEGLRKLLANLYPDNAHFIYEILQNAEDAGAHEVTFHLQTDGLRVDHDGTRLFNLRDIDSITGIGQSTKADDATSIGKFGVGFKAVFAYTQTPAIHSGAYSFAIHDLFVPVRIPVAAGTSHGLTSFWFPFDRPDKPVDRAVEEVANALREISRTTLLFLNNIKLIACSLPDGDERLLERRAVNDHVIAIESAHEEGGHAFWYHIGSDVDVDGKRLSVAAAFALESHASLEKEVTDYSIKPIDGQVFIFFPAINENSGLKFHVHAPFASTVARDSVREDPGNESLVQGVADLVARALPAMREAGLITEGLLSALPNKNDDLPDRYAVLRLRAMSAFNSDELTPAVGGGHVPARALLRSERNIRSALSVDDVNFMRGLAYDIDGALATGWLQSGKGRAGAFLDSLDAVDFGRDALSAALKRVGTIYKGLSSYGGDLDDEERSDISSWGEWICGKSDGWLREFYTTLEALALRTRAYRYSYDPAGDEFIQNLRAAPLIRTQEGEGVRHVPGPQAFMPTAPGLSAERLVVDPLAVFACIDDSDKDEFRSLRAFYEHSRVKLWDAAARLNVRFNAYPGAPATVTGQHLDDLSALKQLLDDRAVASSTYKDRPILAAVRKDGTRYWMTPHQGYLDAPFVTTGLTSLYQSHRYVGTPPGQLAPEYVGKTPDVASLAQTLGAETGLQITQESIWDNPKFESGWRWDNRENQNMTSRDWLVLHFDVIISTGDDALLRSLWHVVTSADTTTSVAIYRSNASSLVRRIPSQLLQSLSSKPWILDRDGNLRLPADMTAEELPHDLHVPANSPLLELAGFGRKAAARALGQQANEQQAKELGFGSADILRSIAEAYKESPEWFLELLQERKMHSLPDAPSVAPDRRAIRAGELSALAPSREYDKRLRSVYIQVPGHRSASKGYLTQIYTNDDGIMVCQVCASAMPFRVAGDYYFEAVQFVKDSKRDLRENRLALCPTCAAKYRHARGTSLTDLREDLLTQNVGHLGSITVDVVLAGEATTVRFGGKHAIDLQAALIATEAEPIEEDDSDELQ